MADESHTRSIVKALSWRMFGTFATMVIAYVLTEKIALTLYIGIFEFTSKVALFYLHERIWSAISFGRKKIGIEN